MEYWEIIADKLPVGVGAASQPERSEFSRYSLANGAIELVIEGIPSSAFIESSQSCKLIFCDRSDRLRGRKHAGDGGKSRRAFVPRMRVFQSAHRCGRDVLVRMTAKCADYS